ncbi:NADH-quinone oxidoreductase subunit N [Verrucomicrobiales bacterium]|nr:NADH-quinone oxidoreductase subunit N [Verrucomicrobiales bacterium]
MPVYYLEILILLLGFTMLGIEAFSSNRSRTGIAVLGVSGLFVVLLFLIFVVPSGGPYDYWGIYHVDKLALFYKAIAILTTLLVLVLAKDFSPAFKKYTSQSNELSGIGEYYCLPIFVCAGLMWMASAKDLITIFVSLELVTIGFYVLVSFMRRNVGSLEAGVKYLVLGALSTGFLVYGIAWIFGVTGQFDLSKIAKELNSGEIEQKPIIFAFALLMVGLGFKVAAVPFHIWVPDVYQGTSMPITAFLSVGSKAAGFIVLLRVIEPFLNSPLTSSSVILILSFLVCVTLLFGNLVAIKQTNVKRLLAYSSIAHAGFLMMVLPAMESGFHSQLIGPSPIDSISFYLAGYLLMTMLCFLVITIVSSLTGGENIDDLRGLGSRSPLLAFAMLVGVASLAGIPLTVGFFGKFLLFNIAIQYAVFSGSWYIVAFAVLGASAGFYYYFKIIRAMYWEGAEQGGDQLALTVSTLSRVVIIALLAGVILCGVFPKIILGFL